MGVQNEICRAPLAILPRNAMSGGVLKCGTPKDHLRHLTNRSPNFFIWSNVKFPLMYPS